MPCHSFAFMSSLKKERDKVRETSKRLYVIGFDLVHYILPSSSDHYFGFWNDFNWIRILTSLFREANDFSFIRSNIDPFLSNSIRVVSDSRF